MVAGNNKDRCLPWLSDEPEFCLSDQEEPIDVSIVKRLIASAREVCDFVLELKSEVVGGTGHMATLAGEAENQATGSGWCVVLCHVAPNLVKSSSHPVSCLSWIRSLHRFAPFADKSYARPLVQCRR